MSDLSPGDIQRIVKDAKIREIVTACGETQPGRIGECAEEQIHERLVELFSKEEPEAKKPTLMREWIDGDPDPSGEACRPCALPVTIQWYLDELRDHGHGDLAEKLEQTALSDDPSTTAQEMDKVKEVVDDNVRERLLEFDAATQANAK